jgi:ribonuclease P protein component
MSPTTPESEPLHFRARHRLTHAREFDAVYAGKVRKVRGPLMVFALPNPHAWPRLGLSVSTRVGGAVRRNAWKRLIREAFRLQQHTLPRNAQGNGYDLIVSVRAAPEQAVWTLPACMKALADLAAEADREWRRRDRRETSDSPTPATPTPEPGQQ